MKWLVIYISWLLVNRFAILQIEEYTEDSDLSDTPMYLLYAETL